MQGKDWIMSLQLQHWAWVNHLMYKPLLANSRSLDDQCQQLPLISSLHTHTVCILRRERERCREYKSRLNRKRTLIKLKKHFLEVTDRVLDYCLCWICKYINCLVSWRRKRHETAKSVKKQNRNIHRFHQIIRLKHTTVYGQKYSVKWQLWTKNEHKFGPKDPQRLSTVS